MLVKPTCHSDFPSTPRFTLVLSCGPQERTCQNAGDCLATEGCDWRKGSCVPQCQDNGNCLHAQRCHVDLRVCLTVCNDDSGCAPEERCEPNDRVCVKTPCPTGVLPKNEKCPCQQQKDCPQDTYCDNFGNKPGMCHAVCHESRISGNDKTRQSTGGFPLFYEPNSCDVLTNQ